MHRTSLLKCWTIWSSLSGRASFILITDYRFFCLTEIIHAQCFSALFWCLAAASVVSRPSDRDLTQRRWPRRGKRCYKLKVCAFVTFSRGDFLAICQLQMAFPTVFVFIFHAVFLRALLWCVICDTSLSH